MVKNFTVISLILFMLSSVSFSQTLLDAFTRADNTTVGNGWTENENGINGAVISSNMLQLNANNANGREWVYQDVSSQYTTIFDNNTGEISWYFNMRLSSGNPGGFNDGRYSATFVIGLDTSDYTIANGYGIAIGRDGGNFPLRLLRFTGGLDNQTKITEIINAGNYATDYINARIVFNPNTGTWTFYAESDEFSFSDPTSVTTQVGSAVVDTTFTDSDLKYLGAFYNHSNGASANALFDNFYIPGGGGTNTIVNFVSSLSSFNEDAGTVNVSVAISNPDAVNPTNVDVALTGGTATNGTDISTYNTTNLTFPAGSGAAQSISITITDDPDIEASETLIFSLQNVTGGNSAAIGLPSTHTLTIIDDEVFEFMISEITDPSDDPAAAYVELYNNDNSTLDFSTETFYLSRQENGHPNKWEDILLSGSVAPGEIFVVANTQSNFFNAFGVNPDMTSSFIDGNGNDGYYLYYGGDHSTGQLVDAFGVLNQDGTGQAWEYTDGHGERNVGVDAPNQTWTNGEWTITSPVTTSELDPTDTHLPIELSLFTATGGNNQVTLKWVTESEVDNLGFYIYRSVQKDGEFKPVSSLIKGAINSASQQKYSYVDKTVFNGITYWYKLVDESINGVKTEHQLISALPHVSSADIDIVDNGDVPDAFDLKSNYPNPFNPETTIGFDIPDIDKELMRVTLSIYDVLGKRVKTLLDENLAPKSYKIKWNGLNEAGNVVPTGIYFYVLQSEYFIKSKKMIFVK